MKEHSLLGNHVKLKEYTKICSKCNATITLSIAITGNKYIGKCLWCNNFIEGELAEADLQDRYWQKF